MGGCGDAIYSCWVKNVLQICTELLIGVSVIKCESSILPSNKVYVMYIFDLLNDVVKSLVQVLKDFKTMDQLNLCEHSVYLWNWKNKSIDVIGKSYFQKQQFFLFTFETLVLFSLGKHKNGIFEPR